MPKVSDLEQIDQDPKVIYNWICTLPTSIYNGMDPQALEKELMPSLARRYLVDLILLNDKNKSELPYIHE